MVAAMESFQVPIGSDSDILVARAQGRALAARLGFPSSDLALVATTISELARNILSYAGTGEVTVQRIGDGHQTGILVIARDKGPGIPDIHRALKDGYSTSGGLGLGLPGVRRLVDEFEIVSEVGRGTTVPVKKWKR
jgi:serine/threonine-protein kinase RsbT